MQTESLVNLASSLHYGAASLQTICLAPGHNGDLGQEMTNVSLLLAEAHIRLSQATSRDESVRLQRAIDDAEKELETARWTTD